MVNRVPFIPPVANFTATPFNGTAPLKVNFTDRSSGSPTQWNYDFGDGVNMTVPNPVHIYRFPGVYNVTLTVLKNDAVNGTMVTNSSIKNNFVVVQSK
jgi:PKD repeat protein